MSIALQVSDLDHERIDGTRIYLQQLLNFFGPLASQEDFLLYHQRAFNPALAPKSFPNYQEKKIPFPWAWMQTRFAWELFREAPTRLFLPIQAAPFLLPAGLEVTATIHDLAWKQYPETFPWKDRLKLNILLWRVVKRADKLICVSEATKADLLRVYPTAEKKVRVIHHGFDKTFFSKRLSQEDLSTELASYNLTPEGYCLYVGALQPRKNLVRLIEAFMKLRERFPESKLVLAGEEAWLSDPITKAAEKSGDREAILLIGRVEQKKLRALYQGARFFAFPSLYEGFGLPLLEAFASETAVLTADNSSLPEVAGNGALYCRAEDAADIAEKMITLWQEQALRQNLIEKGKERLKDFSWETCAEETLAFVQE